MGLVMEAALVKKKKGQLLKSKKRSPGGPKKSPAEGSRGIWGSTLLENHPL